MTLANTRAINLTTAPSQLVAELPVASLSAAAVRPLLKSEVDVEFRKSRRCWEDAFLWLDSKREVPQLHDLVIRVEKSLEHVPFYALMHIWGSKFSTMAISRPLSDSRVSDEFIDMSVLSLVNRVNHGAYKSIRAGVVITTSLLFNLMKDPLSWINPVASAVVKSEGCQYLMMPAFLPSYEHYVVIVIDKKEKQILIGDSMCKSNLWKVSQPMLTQWTERWLDFTPTYGALEHGHQQDAVACGIATVNTMEHFLAGEVPAYSHDGRDELRLQYTLRLCELVTSTKNDVIPSTPLFGIKKSKSFWLCRSSREEDAGNPLEDLVTKQDEPLGNEPLDNEPLNNEPLTIEDSEKVLSSSEQELQLGVLETVDICSRMSGHASFVIQFIHTFKRFPTVSEVVGVGCFAAHSLSSAFPNITDPSPLPLQDMLSNMARAWETSETDRTQNPEQESKPLAGSDEGNEDGQAQGPRKRKRSY